MGKQVTDPRTALSIRLKFPRRWPKVAGFCELDSGFVKGEWFAGVAAQGGLVVKRVHVRRATVHEEENNALGARRKMRATRRQRPTDDGDTFSDWRDTGSGE